MKPWKKPSLLLLVISSCFALLSSCGTSPTGSPATPTPSERTPAATRTAVPTPQPTSPPITCGVWSVVASPNVGTKTNLLHGVAALSTNDVWAVGSASSNQPGSRTLVEHWDGTQWQVVASPNVAGSTDDELITVAALAANDIWAVGDSSIVLPGSQTSQALIEHWDGRAWSIVLSSSTGSFLSDIAAVSAQDMWAVGGGATGALIEHWNGSTWSVVKSPGGSSDRLIGVTALSASDVWAVGSGIGPYGYQTLIEHWNGMQWQVVARGPRPGVEVVDSLTSIAASSANDIWAVGTASGATPSSGYAPLMEHWDGSQWSIIQFPVTAEEYAVALNSIAVVTARDIWVVGNYESEPGEPGPSLSLIAHWNGSTWSMVNSPSPGPFRTELGAVVRVPGSGSIWAVGDTLNYDFQSQTLTEFFC